MAIHIQEPPDAKPERISRLITRIDEGEIKIPEFQRNYIWKEYQLLELLDSIYNGYPIGSLLFWQTSEQLTTERNLGNFDLPDTPEKYPRNYVLDGQQRLVTIYGVLQWSGDPKEDNIFNISFDLQSKKFFHTIYPPFPTHIAMNILFDTRRFRAFQNTLPVLQNGQEYLDSTDVLLETFREYSIPVVTVTEASVENIASIFERINSTGTKLTVYDLMVAATWSSKFDLREKIEDSLEDLIDKDYRDISPVSVLQILAAHIDNSAKRQTVLELRKHPSDELTAKMADVSEALKRAVDFLITEVYAKSSDFLPYERQLVALAYVYTKIRMPHQNQINNLRRWFWRTSFSERYRRGGEGLFDDDLTNVVASLDNPAVLDRFGKPPASDDIKRTEFRSASAFSNAFVDLLASYHPRNFVNGTRIDTGKALSKYNRKEFHHIFPQAYLTKHGIPKSKINSVANICMLSADQNKIIGDKAPSIYVTEMQKTHADQFDDVLTSNLIPPEAAPYLFADDFEGFLETRSQHIARVIFGHT